MGSLKSVEQILKEMGFNSDSKESTQFALFRHLKKAAASSLPVLPTPIESKTSDPVQLEFDLDGPTSWTEPSTIKKVSNR